LRGWPLVLALACLVAALPASALADGGTVQLSNQPAGSYRFSVFTAPSPIPVGVVDVSLLLQRLDSDDLVQDARVTVKAEPVGHAGTARTFPATHANASNKLYYAANVELADEGAWRLTLHADGTLGPAEVEFRVTASRPSFLGTVGAWPLAVLPIGLAAYLAAARMRNRARG
jgi:hypothetical protein